MLLGGKNAVIYGAGDGVGGGVARTFGREGANAFLAGRTRGPLEVVADEIRTAGGSAEVTVVDAFDERSVEEHARDVAERAGGIDVSFNLVTRGDVQGIPLAEMETEDFIRPVVNEGEWRLFGA